MVKHLASHVWPFEMSILWYLHYLISMFLGLLVESGLTHYGLHVLLVDRASKVFFNKWQQVIKTYIYI